MSAPLFSFAAPFLDAVERERSLLVEELWNAPKALLLSLLCQRRRRLLVIIGEREGASLIEDLPYFGITHASHLPAWETGAGELLPPSPDIAGRRLALLHRLATSREPQLLFAPLQACLQRVVGAPLLTRLCSYWRVGERLPFQQLPERLLSLGYQRASVAQQKGEFALRGGIVDLFPIAARDPYRIEFLGDQIDQIRTYDPQGQKSTARVQELFVTPASEWQLLKSGEPLSDLFEAIGEESCVVFDDLAALEDQLVAVSRAMGPAQLQLPMEELMQKAEALTRLFWTADPIEKLSAVQPAVPTKASSQTQTRVANNQIQFQIFNQEVTATRWRHPFCALPPLEALEPYTTRFICSHSSEEEALRAKVTREHPSLLPHASFERGYLSSGLLLPGERCALFPMAALTHIQRMKRESWRTAHHVAPSDFHAIAPGDIVVHFHHGIAKYLGVEKRVNHLGKECEFLLLEYASKSTLYVPLHQAYLVSRYIGTQDEIPLLSTLGSGRWEKMRAQAQKTIAGYAQQLLQLQAERTLRGGVAFAPDSSAMEAFEAEFPFQETEDQLRAIAEVKTDMCSSKAMDRLICGDVGYGKTEVAMRAAFKAAYESKKQVAILVPTTVLALQHFENFQARMANFSLRVALLSRMHTPKENRQTIAALARGEIDIVIGTHRVISKDVAFKELGLIIIDEEQRFGVRAKEHLKLLKAGVDCLTLSATPIPRTLYMTLVGSRDISTLHTPPQDRLPIQTIIAPREGALIRSALLRELARGGQVFFIHNRIDSLPAVVDELKQLAPAARIAAAHGQMDAEMVDTLFHHFRQGSLDVLVATTIIENGIDVPNANTILVDRADQFGMADLYQIRGRVGRWDRPAYAYFLLPAHRIPSEVSSKRLEALASTSGFGGGIKIAMRDLEMRGSGDLLGTEQSGQIASIGFHLYCKLLKRAIDALKKKRPIALQETRIEGVQEAYLPESYVDDTSIRMEIYYRLGEAESFEQVDELLDELRDRFGAPPTQAIALYHLTRLKVFASQHEFSFLRFEARALVAERLGCKQTLPLAPQRLPLLWEREVVEALQKAFPLTGK